ncbi:hypothetical protein UFOVP481_13 [uncultured Caudovirales phage]|uniref:Uncharacterized protein n=1 Tax=uncultured Caudovirales phage TaxID=2100421 RepID=A0A6J5MJ06_9CAUD|nr:hypothetical protein UFOVP481_13 [uncultured Caudovirales phage]CAB4190924.1 hypothetical protein UFOVP1210_16 [uncultured Caudovirales phage]
MMNSERAFDAGYTRALMSLDAWMRVTLSQNSTVLKVRAELIAMLNDAAYGTWKEDIDAARAEVNN